MRQVRVGVGPLSGIEPRLLESAYPLASAGTRAEGSLKQRCNTIEEIHRGISH
jgi:Zn finger protein HypA/HybF involved in hydrogenase expression